MTGVWVFILTNLYKWECKDNFPIPKLLLLWTDHQLEYNQTSLAIDWLRLLYVCNLCHQEWGGWLSWEYPMKGISLLGNLGRTVNLQPHTTTGPLAYTICLWECWGSPDWGPHAISMYWFVYLHWPTEIPVPEGNLQKLMRTPQRTWNPSRGVLRIGKNNEMCHRVDAIHQVISYLVHCGNSWASKFRVRWFSGDLDKHPQRFAPKIERSPRCHLCPRF